MIKTPLTGEALVAGVAGTPVRHSLSPLIHNAWIEAAGLDAVYIPIEVAKPGFAPLLQGLRRSSVRGLNVTIPFKEQALAIADIAHPFARAAGAANIVLFHSDGTIEARNTDGPGLLAALDEQAPGWAAPHVRAVVLGAGGAARGAVAALMTRQVSDVRIVNRTPSRAQALAGRFAGLRAFAWADLAYALGDATLVVNATAAGLSGEGDLAIPWGALPADAVVMDMVYRPLRTPFLERARERGCRTVDGMGMLIGQARPAFEAFFGRPPPAEVDVRRLALTAIGEAE